ncbi:hypothetical protein ETB97_011168 [Aspergillus alliaceus]|uniref:RRM domain-containing protein n=1 Tax=Petromyces alliaceus TaxID=209559 RepID=A0A8H6AAM1_PETAA|nr:hypothetical protein ETB97_011168 [Aspergillus burnettii]
MVTVLGADLSLPRDLRCCREAEAEAGVGVEVGAPDGTGTKAAVGLLALQIAFQEAQKSLHIVDIIRETHISKIVVEKLTKNVTESHLREIFGSFGGIESLDLPMNKAFMTNRGTAYILYNDPADAEAAIAHMHESQLDGAVLNVSIVLPRRAFSRSPPPPQAGRGSFGRQRNSRGHHPTREGQIAPGLWKDMTFIARGHYLDLDHHVDPGQSRQNPGQWLHRGGGDSYVLVVLDVVDAVVLVTVVTTTAATVTGVELQAEIGALIDTVRLDDE